MASPHHFRPPLPLWVAVIALLLIGMTGRPAEAATLGFDLGTSFFLPGEKLADSGTANFIVITFPISAKTEIGFYREELGFALEDNEDGGAVTRVDSDVSIDAIRIVQTIAGPVAVGLNIGAADVTGALAGAVTFADLVPMADIFGRVTLLSGGEPVQGNLAVTLGYRFLRIQAADPDGLLGTDFTDTVDNLGGFSIGISAGVRF